MRPNFFRTDDTVAACGAGHVAGAGAWPCRERPEVGHSGQQRGAISSDSDIAAGVRSATGASGRGRFSPYPIRPEN